MAYEARCKNCGDILFDVPNFQAISEARPVKLTCRGCGIEYRVTHKGEDILYRAKGETAEQNIKAERYG